MFVPFSKLILATAFAMGLLIAGNGNLVAQESTKTSETQQEEKESAKNEAAKTAEAPQSTDSKAAPIVKFGAAPVAQTVAQTPATPLKDDSDKGASLQDDSEKKPAKGVSFANPITTRWRMNAIIKGGSGPAHSMFVTIPIPANWPEQSVAIVDEDLPANIAKVSYRNLESGVRQLVGSIPQVRAREDIKISVTFEVLTSQIIAPPDTSIFVRPKTSHRDGRNYLGVGPQINYRSSKLKSEVKTIVKDKTKIWDQVEAIYDWVRDNIEDTATQPQDALNAFRARKGCAEDKVGLFVAMCRAHKIPARMVWVQGAQYAEFMLIDAEKKPHWFPCDVGGVREFGSVSEPRIILQKGDSIRVPEKDGRQKLVAEFATCKGKSKPSVRFHREVLASD